MPADRGVGAVEYRSRGEQSLGGEKALFDIPFVMPLIV
jgi:hypothetical protein